MTTLLDKIAKDVVIRHVCDCKTAPERPEADESQEHVFTVDGLDFPWHITERGQVVRRLRDDLYSVDIEVVLLSKGDLKMLDFSYLPCGEHHNGPPYIPVIGGVEFPWLLTEDGCQLTFGHKMWPTLRLAFLAHHVDANIPIEDCRPGLDDGDMIFCAGGDLISGSKERCRFGCDEVIDGSMWDHIEQAHPERISTRTRDGREHPVAYLVAQEV